MTDVENAIIEEAPTPKLSPAFICYVCRRRLASAEMLRKHEEMSALHEKNLKALRMTNVRKRSEIRTEVLRLRAWSSGPNIELESCERELGLAQEEVETEANSVIQRKAFTKISNASFSFEGCSWTGNKPTNEDRMVLGFSLAQGTMTGCLVADGHCGEACADYVVEHLVKNIDEALGEVSLSKAVEIGFKKTDSSFLEFAQAYQIPAGSTVVVAIFFPTPESLSEDETCEPILEMQPSKISVLIAHLGDSRALMVSNDTTTRLSLDHKPDRPDEKERLEAAGGLVVDVGGVWRVFTPGIVSVGGRALQWGLAVSRAFGDLALKQETHIVSGEAEIKIFHDIPSKIILACDGIFDVLTDEQVGAHTDSSAILRHAYGKLSDDNLTAIVVHIDKTEENELMATQMDNKHDLSTRSDSPSGKKQRVLSPQPPPGRIAYERARGEFDDEEDN